MQDIMIDFETLSVSQEPVCTRFSAIIFDIGAQPDIKREYPPAFVFDKYFSIAGCLNANLIVDDDVLNFWLKNSRFIPDAVNPEAEVFDPALVVAQFYEFVLNFNRTMQPDNHLLGDNLAHFRLWSRGSDFDFAILKTLHERTGFHKWFKYDAGRDLRTILEAAFGDTKPLILVEDIQKGDLNQHNPVDDCKVQIFQLLSAIEKLDAEDF